MSYRVEASGNTAVMTVTVARAKIDGNQPERSSRIDITEPIDDVAPDWAGGDLRPYMAASQAFYLQQAEDIYRALRHALPDGTLDALLGVMCREQASLLRVPHVPLAQAGDDR